MEKEKEKKHVDEPKKQQEETKSYEIVFNGKTVTKLKLGKDVDLNQAWSEFQKENAGVGDKRAVFPTAFVGYLVAKHKAEQIDAKEKTDLKHEIRM